MRKICIFAGTTEGRKLIELLQGRGVQIAACAATEYGGDLVKGLEAVSVHIGRMNAEEMVDFFATGQFELVVDAKVVRRMRTACGSAMFLPASNI